MVRKDKAFIFIIILEILALMFASVGIWIAYTNLNIEASYYEIKSDLIPDEFDGFKIAHVSDLHDKNWKGKLEEKIAAEKPDIIVITGDIVDSSDKYFYNSLSFVENALKTAPVYFVTGNHEAAMREYEYMRILFEKTGMKTIDDKSVIIEKNGAYINLAGIKDHDFTVKKDVFLDNTALIESIISEKINSLCVEGIFNIVLIHRPEYFETYAQTQADLVLCGHAHGGQIRIPFAGGLIAPDQGFFPEYSEGLHSENGTSMIVSRGLGDSSIPVRINNMPELVIVTLKSEQ